MNCHSGVDYLLANVRVSFVHCLDPVPTSLAIFSLHLALPEFYPSRILASEIFGRLWRLDWSKGSEVFLFGLGYEMAKTWQQ